MSQVVEVRQNFLTGKHYCQWNCKSSFNCNMQKVTKITLLPYTFQSTKEHSPLLSFFFEQVYTWPPLAHMNQISQECQQKVVLKKWVQNILTNAPSSETMVIFTVHWSRNWAGITTSQFYTHHETGPVYSLTEKVLTVWRVSPGKLWMVNTWKCFPDYQMEWLTFHVKEKHVGKTLNITYSA